MDISDYVAHPRCQLADGDWSTGVNMMFYPCCPEPYSVIKFRIYFKALKEGDNYEAEKEFVTELLKSG